MKNITSFSEKQVAWLLDVLERTTQDVEKAVRGIDMNALCGRGKRRRRDPVLDPAR